MKKDNSVEIEKTKNRVTTLNTLIVVIVGTIGGIFLTHYLNTSKSNIKDERINSIRLKLTWQASGKIAKQETITVTTSSGYKFDIQSDSTGIALINLDRIEQSDLGNKITINHKKYKVQPPKIDFTTEKIIHVKILNKKKVRLPYLKPKPNPSINLLDVKVYISDTSRFLSYTVIAVTSDNDTFRFNNAGSIKYKAFKSRNKEYPLNLYFFKNKTTDTHFIEKIIIDKKRKLIEINK